MKNILPAVALLLSSSFASAAAVGGKDFAPSEPVPHSDAAVKPQTRAAAAPSKRAQVKRAIKKATPAKRA